MTIKQNPFHLLHSATTVSLCIYRYRPTCAPEVAYSNVATNSTVIPRTIGVIFQARLVASYAAVLTGRKIKLCNYLMVRMRPAGIALNYSIKDIRKDVQQIYTSKMIYHRGCEPERAMHC